MSNLNTKRTFFDLFDSDKPVLKVKFRVHPGEEAIDAQIVNEISKEVDAKGLTKLEALCKNPRLSDFIDFYSKYDAFSLGTTILPKNTINKPLLRQLPVSSLAMLTEQYLPNGRGQLVLIKPRQFIEMNISG